MAEPTTEKLVININVDDKGAITKLDGLLAKIREIDTATKGDGFQHLKEITKSVNELGKTAAKLDKVAKVFESVASQNQNLAKSLQSVKGMNSVFKGLASNVRGAKAAMDSLMESANGNNADAGAKNIFSSLSAKDLGNFVGSVGTEFKRMAKFGAKVTQLPFKMLFEPMRGLATRVADLAKGFDNLFQKIGRVALMRGIRAAIRMVTAGIREGVNDLYLWASAVGNSFKPTMDSIASSFLYLKNSIGAAVSPILDALAPAIEIAVNKLVELINVFNQVIATLTGATFWRKAIRSAADYSDGISGLGHDAQDANDAVKELKRTILGFDEINRLDDKTKTVSKGSNGKDPTGYYAKDGAFSFDNVPISSSVENLAQKLRDAWDRADFTEIGTMIGEKVGKALLDVPWESDIQPAVEKLATSFGTLLNGMFDYTGSGGKAMWDGIAYTIYSAINTALLGRVTFFKTVNWNGIGQGIGAALSDVVYNINWDLVTQNLSAFPNAVIDAITGFCTQMSPADFHQAGIKIGGSVADALIDIKWDDLFQDGFKMADRLLQAINGVLEGFGTRWGEIKTGIINGIKSVSPDEWAKIGTDIGKLIFNAASFVGNMVDLLVSAVKEGKWASLLNGIWTGIDEKIKLAYGSWGGAALALARWIGTNIGLLTIAFTFALGKVALGFGAEALKKAILDSAVEGIKSSVGTAGASTLGSFLSAIPVVAGLALVLGGVKTSADAHLQDNINRSLVETMKGVFEAGFGGALVGFGLASKIGMTGLAAGSWGFAVATGIALSFSAITSMADSLARGDGEKFAEELVGAIVGSAFGAAIGLTVGPGGAFVGGLIGFGIGAKLHILLEKLDFGYEGITGNAWTDWYEGSLLQGIVNGLGFGADTVYAADGQTGQQSYMSDQVLKFKVAPDVTNSDDWWKDVNGTWEGLMAVHKAARFHVAGVVNEAEEWWRQARTFWENKVSPGTTKAARFHVMGVVNEVTTWWDQLQNFWTNGIANRKASRFQVTGVVNDSSTWWQQTDTFWTNATRNSKLYASVGITDLWNSFADAWNTLQGYFNKNPLTATVVTKTSSSDPTHTATGGVYKNGSWHDVTAYAGGGLPGTGQMFIARESGPELVGTLAGSTAVMNNDQIVSSVSDGVARAVAAVLGGSQRDSVNDITIKVDSEVLYRATKKGERKANGRYGTVVAVG